MIGDSHRHALRDRQPMPSHLALRCISALIEWFVSIHACKHHTHATKKSTESHEFASARRRRTSSFILGAYIQDEMSRTRGKCCHRKDKPEKMKFPCKKWPLIEQNNAQSLSTTVQLLLITPRPSGQRRTCHRGWRLHFQFAHSALSE